MESTFITILIMFGLYKLFEKLVPLDQAEFQTDRSIDDLRKKYKSTDLKYLGLFAFLTIGFTVLIYFLFKGIVLLKMSMISDALIVVAPYPEMVFAVSFFSGMLSSSIAMSVISKQQLKDDWEEYQAYNNLKYKYNYAKVTKYGLRVFAIIVLVLNIGVLDWYSAFGQNEIEVNGMLSIGTTKYMYNDIRQIKQVERIKAPSGEIRREPHFIIEFSNGKNWNSRENGFVNDRLNNEILEMVIAKTHLELIALEFDHAE